jgi:hypothetical protein
MGRLALLLTGLLLVSCASGDEEEEMNDNIFPDSSVRPIIDASPRRDAPPSTLPDGGFGEGFLCDDHSDCTEAGTCCWLNPVIEMFVCLPGTVEPITMVCIPDFNP